VQVNTSIQESVLMLKGFETKQENLEASRAASVEKAESETGKGRGSEAKTKSETGSLAGGSQTADKKSRQGAKPGVKLLLASQCSLQQLLYHFGLFIFFIFVPYY